MIQEFGLREIKKEIWGKKETNQLLGSNVLLIGATQTGKSTLADMMIEQVSNQQLGKNVIFEVKGERIQNIRATDYYVTCSDCSDYVGNGKRFTWSILKEATISGSKQSVERRIANIYEPIFRRRIDNSTQPYFIKAASHILSGLTYALYLKYGVISNKALFTLLEQMDVTDYLKVLAETGVIKKYARDLPIIDNKISGQTAGVLGELTHYINSFSRMFVQDGYDSIYEFCTSPECSNFYFLYDFNSREDADLLYAMLLNQIIAYKLSYVPIGNQKIYMFLDEIAVLQNADLNLKYAANLGTSKDLHLIIAVQNIQLLGSIYGDDVSSILEGFDIVAFRVNQQETKNFIKDRVGMEIDSVIISMPMTRKEKATYQINRGNQITDSLIESLEVGTAIIKLGIQETKIVKFICGKE